MSGGDQAREAVAQFVAKHPVAVGWVYTPFEAFWVRANPTGPVRCDPANGAETPVNGATWSAVFEVRLFDSATELRWRLDQRTGDGVKAEWSDGEAPEGLQPVPQEQTHQLLWGCVASVAESEWVKLADARIGSFWVPPVESAQEGDRVSIGTVEYMSVDEHGNAAVADQRFTRLSVANPEEAQS